MPRELFGTGGDFQPEPFPQGEFTREYYLYHMPQQLTASQAGWLKGMGHTVETREERVERGASVLPKSGVCTPEGSSVAISMKIDDYLPEQRSVVKKVQRILCKELVDSRICKVNKFKCGSKKGDNSRVEILL